MSRPQRWLREWDPRDPIEVTYVHTKFDDKVMRIIPMYRITFINLGRVIWTLAVLYDVTTAVAWLKHEHRIHAVLNR